MTAVTGEHRVAPFEGLIDRLSRKAVEEQHPDIARQVRGIASGGEVNQIDGWVAGMLGLARGSVFMPAPDVERPFLFAAQVGSHKTHVVVGREYGDVSWPAYIAKNRRTAGEEARIRVRQGLSDVIAWLNAGRELREAYEASLRPPEPEDEGETFDPTMIEL